MPQTHTDMSQANFEFRQANFEFSQANSEMSRVIFRNDSSQNAGLGRARKPSQIRSRYRSVDA
jgi:hypothetical protein